MKQSNDLISMEKIPRVIFGTSGLGNLFVALDEETKCDIVRECIVQSGSNTVVFDSAGKYGAGLALEVLGRCLKKLNVPPEKIIISNKLGWLRTELKTTEPTFEPGVWKNLEHDAVQKISYQGIMECFEQGNTLLDGYIPQWVSVHDPDEYLAVAQTKEQEEKLYQDILDAYKALAELKQQGKVQAIGVGAKNWKTLQRIANDVQLDWVMVANSLTIKNHPQELLDFIASLHQQGVFVINSAVFHSGFLTGSDCYDYQNIQPDTPAHKALFDWRDKFFELCKRFNILPAEACVQFALNVPGVKSVALNTTAPKRVKKNIEITGLKIPDAFWHALKTEGLITADHPINTEAVV
jgi:D-threo-aldose 1-dehydrogenase